MNTAAASPAPAQPDFLQLVAELRPRLHRYCARMTGSIPDGEDVVQETLIKATQGYDAQAVQHAEGWLFRIAHNAAMDFLRRRAREEAVFTEDDPETIIDTQAEADRRHVATAALRTFMRLPATQRSTVILADVLGYSLDETAEVMGTTLPAVKAALHRGRVRLRELAQQPDDAAPTTALSASDQALLEAYAERFNARDFDGLRDMLGEEVRLDLVARHKVQGRAAVSNYFGNYAKFAGVGLPQAALRASRRCWSTSRVATDPVRLRTLSSWSGKAARFQASGIFGMRGMQRKRSPKSLHRCLRRRVSSRGAVDS